jgi:hypothetical protein
MNKPLPPDQLELIEKALAGTKADEPNRFGADDDTVIIKSQPAVCVYENVYGAIVIAQEASPGDEDDHYVKIRPEHVPTLIKALKEYCR